MFVGKGKGENKILKEFVWTIIFKIFFPRYLVVRRTTRSEFLVVLIHFMVVEDTRTREFCYPAGPGSPVSPLSRDLLCSKPTYDTI